MSQPDVTTSGPPPVPEPTPPTRPRPRSWWRVGFYTLTLAIVLWAAVLVPLPYVEYVPGGPTEIEPLLEIEGTETTELDGSASLLTVFLRQQPTLQSLRAAVSDQRRLIPLAQVFPPDVDRDTFFAGQREVFGRQFEIAAVIGAQAAGVETTILSEPVVVSVLPGSPADGVLQPRDVIVAVDGQAVVAAEEIQARTRAGAVGEQIALEVRRGEETIQTSVVLGELPGVDFPAMGISVETAVYDIELPFDVRLASTTRIGGPSAGMMVAVTVYDLLAEEDLLRGRTVLGTGSVDADGRVGPVGGVPEKMLAAAEYGADVVLVPASQLDQALTTAPPDLDVIGVATVEEAIDALRGKGR
ncbi:PDZ domain-containing protein [Egicoccus sp. AB-alg2]|uniref:PDZ domain-containing protein n=1 Tax=Egicoccus sp. AB-alg2 TaxID=3242693 RepID=UPI00359EC816